MKNISAIFIFLFLMTSCKELSRPFPSVIIKEVPLEVIDIFNCGAAQTYKVDINNDGVAEKIIFARDIEKSVVKAYVYVEKSLVLIPLKTIPKISPLSRYAFVVTPDPLNEGFYFNIACGTEHKEYYKYKNHAFTVSTIGMP